MYTTNYRSFAKPALVNDFFNDRFAREWSPALRNPLGTDPSANVKETDENYTIELAAPGLTKEDFKVRVEGKHLIISSEKKTENEEKKEKYNRREFHYSAFSRTFILPETVNQEAIHATYTNGILSLVLPKKSEVIQKSQREISVL